MIEQIWAKLRLEGETATLTRDLLLEVHRRACKQRGEIFRYRCGERGYFCPDYKRIEALPDYSEDEA